MKPIAAARVVPVQSFPLYASKVAAGFPSPADDYIETRLDLNEHLIAHKEATFFLRVEGFSMVRAGINHGDLIIVDRALEPRHKSIVVAVVNGELTVKSLYRLDGVVKLVAEADGYPDIVITPETDLVIWGVVKHVVRSFG